MAKRIIIFIVFLILLFTSAFGQQDTSNKKTFFAIKTDLAFLSAYAFPVIYDRGYMGVLTVEQGFSYKHSFQLTAWFLKYTDSQPREIWRFIPEYKFFLSKKGNFKGFYTGIYLKYVNQVNFYPYLSAHDDRTKDKYHTYGAGATFGFQTYIKKHLTFDILLGFGGRYITNSVESPAGSNVFGINSRAMYPLFKLDGRFSINLGYKF